MFRLVSKRILATAGRRQLAHSIKSAPILKYSLPLAIGISTFAIYQTNPYISLDAQQFISEETVNVDSVLRPFPIKISASDGQFVQDVQLLGHGVRTVTFLAMKVYGIGIYVAEQDIAKVREIIAQIGAEKLTDPKQSEQVIGEMLANGVRFVARICPTRNTDFNHLKDGLIKSILAHPKSKEVREELNIGLDQLREAFQGRRGSVPKNHCLYLETRENGKLAVSYLNPFKHEIVHMGIIEEPLISRQLFLQYLTGVKPLSEPLRKSTIDGLLRL